MLADRAEQAFGVARSADRRAEIHHRLHEISRVSCGPDSRRALADFPAGLRQRSGDREEPRHHPLDIGIDRHRIFAERDRGDRGGGIIAEPRQFAQLRFGAGKTAPLGDDPRAFHQIAGPRIISQPGPGRHDLLIARSGEVGYRRPARDPRFPARAYGGDGGLLQHDFGQPYAIGVVFGPFPARRHAPRQRTGMARIPIEQIGGELCGSHSGSHSGSHRCPMA